MTNEGKLCFWHRAIRMFKERVVIIFFSHFISPACLELIKRQVYPARGKQITPHHPHLHLGHKECGLTDWLTIFWEKTRQISRNKYNFLLLTFLFNKNYERNTFFRPSFLGNFYFSKYERAHLLVKPASYKSEPAIIMMVEFRRCKKQLFWCFVIVAC